MNFNILIADFEKDLKENFQIELLELNYMPYLFGSGFAVYRIKGRNVKISLDGRDNTIELYSGLKHDKYPQTTWHLLFTGLAIELAQTGIKELIRILNS